MYCGYITTLKNVRPHPNADKMKLADCFGNTVCVGLDAQEHDIVLYFPTDGQLSEEYCSYNDLVRRKDENGNPAGGYLDPEKRNIKAIKLRGEKSDGLVMPLSSLAFCYESNSPDVGVMNLSVGDQITTVNGHDICTKYIPKSNHSSYTGGAINKKGKKAKDAISPLFSEHVDTEQLAYNLGSFRCGDEIEITLKMHGTSQRTGHLPVLQGYKRSIWDKIFRRTGTPIYSYGFVSGTRRVVLEDYAGGFYGSNDFREQHSKAFEGKLMKGETVYYEVVGFTSTGAPIMASADNRKLNDKNFIKHYGLETVFSYGCRPLSLDMNPSYFEGNIDEGIVKDYPQSDIYVYRMTMTNEDGFTVEYTPDFMHYRCEQMGVKCVPVLWKGVIPEDVNPGEWVLAKAEEFYDGHDPIGKTHVREGVVVRILNRPKFAVYKHKNFAFKVLEGLIKDTAAAPDMEEAQEVSNEEI